MNIPDLQPKVADTAATSLPAAAGLTATGGLAPFLGVIVFIPTIVRSRSLALATLLVLIAVIAAGLVAIRAFVSAVADTPLATLEIPETVIHAGAAAFALGLATIAFVPVLGATLAILGLTTAGTPVGLWAAGEVPTHLHVATAKAWRDQNDDTPDGNAA